MSNNKMNLSKFICMIIHYLSLFWNDLAEKINVCIYACMNECCTKIMLSNNTIDATISGFLFMHTGSIGKLDDAKEKRE